MRKINMILLYILISITILNANIINKTSVKVENIVYLDDNNKDIAIDKIFIDDKEVNMIPKKDANVVFEKGICNNASVSWNSTEWTLVFDKITTKTSCSLYFKTKQESIIPETNEETSNIDEDKGNSNPATGTFFNFVLAVVLAGISLYIIYFSKKITKFHKI